MILKRIKFNSPLRAVALVYFVFTFALALGFLMLVMNTGMMIYEKVRLQSAVDLAAYAGASVQAAYLGNDSSGGQSIKYYNSKILERWIKLVNNLRSGYYTPWPQGFPDPGSCAAVCAAASLNNGRRVEEEYKNAAKDIEEIRGNIEKILQQLPDAARLAAEETLKANIPDLDLGGGGVSGLLAETTNSAEEILKQKKESGNTGKKKKNAVLTFSSGKGAYLANVVGAVPHVFPWFGPACFDANEGEGISYYYCMVNGQGAPGGQVGYQAAALAYARSLSPVMNGNIGNISKIAQSNNHALRLNFIQNSLRPEPFVVVSAEWYPEGGSFMNLENSLGAKGSLFPKRTRLVAVAGAEPFGADLAQLGDMSFGTRLQSIRKLLLDPRIRPVKEDYGQLLEYFQSLGPVDQTGSPVGTADDVIRRFLH